MTKAEYDQSIVLRLRAAREQRRAEAEDHRCEGRKPYGSLPGEAVILERIRRDRAAGATLQAIATGLNVQRIPPRMRRPIRPDQSPPRWHAKTIARIVARLPAQTEWIQQSDDQSDSLFPGDRVYQTKFARVTSMADSLRNKRRRRARFGYKKERDHLVEVPAEQQTVARIQDLCSTNSNAEIATALNDQKVPTRSGRGNWTASKIKKIISENEPLSPGTGTKPITGEPLAVDSREVTPPQQGADSTIPEEPFTPTIPFGYEWRPEDSDQKPDLVIRHRVPRKPVGLRRLRPTLVDFYMVRSAEEQDIIENIRHLHDVEEKSYTEIAELLKMLVKVPEALVESRDEQEIIRRLRFLRDVQYKRYREIAALLYR